MTSIQAPADKRFRRAHVTPSRRRRLWPPNWRYVAAAAVLLAVLGYGGYRATTWALRTEALTIRRITVEGNARLSTGEVTTLLDGLIGQPMLAADLEHWKGVLKASPWVADVAFRRVFPGRIAVAVVERAPVGIGRFGDALYLLDHSASLIDEYGPNYAELDLPILNGLAAPHQEDAPVVDEARAALAIKVVDALGARRDLASRVSEIDVTDAHNAVVTLKDDPTQVRLGEEQFAYRLQTYLDLSPTLRERVPGADYVDVRFDNRVYVRPVVTASAKPSAYRPVVEHPLPSNRVRPDLLVSKPAESRVIAAPAVAVTRPEPAAAPVAAAQTRPAASPAANPAVSAPAPAAPHAKATANAGAKTKAGATKKSIKARAGTRATAQVKATPAPARKKKGRRR